jgi:hypothetical protein
MRVRIADVVLVCAAFVAPAYADVTFKMKVGGSGLDSGNSGDRTDYIKGNKLRMDLSVAGEQRSVIVDLDTHQLIFLEPRQRMASIVDMRTLAAEMAKAVRGDLKASVTATSGTRQIAGATCTVHDLKVTLPPPAVEPAMSMVLTGSACLVKGGSGAADLSAFYQAAAEKGLFFGDPNAPTEPGPALLMTGMYRELVSRGVPFATELKTGVEATGAMAEVMKQMGGMGDARMTTTEVVSVSTATIPPSTFQVPAGYDVVKQSP